MTEELIFKFLLMKYKQPDETGWGATLLNNEDLFQL